MINIAQWDTDNFGIKIGNLIIEDEVSQYALQKEIEYAKSLGYELLYLKGLTLPEDCISENVVLADEKVEYVITTDGRDYKKDKHVKSILHSQISEKLLDLAFESGTFSRYKVDQKMPRSVFKTLYRIWITNSLNETISTDVLAYLEDGQPLGILTYKQGAEKVTIGLIAVDKQNAAKGIGTKLMQTFLSKFPIGTLIEVATQKRNFIACHYYEKNGFRINSITNIYHIWVK